MYYIYIPPSPPLLFYPLSQIVFSGQVVAKLLPASLAVLEFVLVVLDVPQFLQAVGHFLLVVVLFVVLVDFEQVEERYFVAPLLNFVVRLLRLDTRFV